MRSVRVTEVLSLVLPLVFIACEKDQPAAKAPVTAQPYKTPPTAQQMAPHDASYKMTPASSVDEADFREGTATEMLDAAQLSDAQIASITDAAHAAEVSKAQLALTKAQDARVRAYAQSMIDHHGKARHDQTALVTSLGMSPSESPKLIELRSDTADTLKTLEGSPVDIFDRVYMDIEIADQRRFLDSLDRGLIPNSDNADLKLSLEALRPTVVTHLREARDLSYTLQQ